MKGYAEIKSSYWEQNFDNFVVFNRKPHEDVSLLHINFVIEGLRQFIYLGRIIDESIEVFRKNYIS